MRTDSTLNLMRDANPVATRDAASLADMIDLRSLVYHAVADVEKLTPEPIGRHRVWGRRRRPILYTLAGIAVALAVAVSPAWAFLRDVLPFSQAPHAPAAVQVDFASLNSGAPTVGMNPQAIPDQTRQVLDVPVNGTDHILYVGPTAKGGFCFEWTGWWGGCDADGSGQLSWQTSMEIPPGVVAPTVPALGPGPHTVAQDGAWEQAVKKLRSLAVPTWIAGVVNANGAQAVVIEFSDGTSTDTDITWVSAPISAGFFSYLPPDDKRTEADHVTNVKALDAQGNVVAQQPLTP